MPPGTLHHAGLSLLPQTHWQPTREWLPPLPSPLLARPRLERRLAAWAPVTVVRGRQGSGKTTLVASWLNSQSVREVTPLWITADTGMLGMDAFNRQLGLAMYEAGMIQPARSNTASSGALGRLHDTLLATSIDRKVVLVIDDIWHVPGDSVLRSVLSLVERHRHFHVIGCGRGRHPIEALAGASGELSTISTRDLALDASEIEELARLAGRQLGRADAERLKAAVGGCISVIKLILDASDEDELPLAAGLLYGPASNPPESADAPPRWHTPLLSAAGAR
jgi:ATP/maltotriose-dependent transcriptional regulator MalT